MTNSSLDDITIKHLVEAYIKETLKSMDYYINMQDSVSRHMAQGQLDALEILKTEKEEALFERSYKCMDNIVDRLLDGRTVDKPSRNKLSRAVLRAAIDLDTVQIKAMEGEPVPTNLYPDADNPNPTPLPQDQTDLIETPPLETIMQEHESANTGWTIATRADYRGCAKAALKILGNIPVGSITRSIMVEYRKTLLKVPTYWASRHKNVLVSDLPIPGVTTLAKSTIETNLVYMNSLMNYAVDCGHLKESPMPRSRMSIPDDKIDVYSFSDDQIKTIMDATQNFDDHKYWIPRLGLYTGCRLNELCQLHKSDLKQVNGVWYLDINNSGKKTLKNKASKRLIPLHPVLIDLGFITFVDKVDHHRIFPGCKYRPKTGKYGNNFGSWFSRTALVKTKIKESHDRSITFHSFRHRFITVLKRLKVEHTLVQQLSGHAMQGTSDREYFDGHLLPALKEIIDILPDHRELI